MVIGIIGESCVGKSTLANELKKKLNAKVYSGKDYLRLAKNEADAREEFLTLLENTLENETIIYVTSEKEQISLLPIGALKILITADLEVIEKRFAERMHGVLPLPVKQMLERKHGCFDDEKCDIHIDGTECNYDFVYREIMDKRVSL